MDGQSLSRLLHKRGINVRYLGKLIGLGEIEKDQRLKSLEVLATQEMIARAFKHIANGYLKNLPNVFATSCLAHLLNCLLGSGMNERPTALLDEDLKDLYPDGDYAFTELTPSSLRQTLEKQVRLRYRYSLRAGWEHNIKYQQLLRDVALKLGLQIVAKDYQFGRIASQLQNGTLTSGASDLETEAMPNGHVNGHTVNGVHGKKRRKGRDNSPPVLGQGSESYNPILMFSPDDIANILPVVKDACPKSILAEEALEAGRISIMQNQQEIGQELLLQSMSLHEQVYGMIHPEVARVYHQLAMLYYQLNEKAAAVELEHKAVILSERTLGVDSNETILCYLNLGLFEHGNGNTTTALFSVRHALELWKVIYGPKHPDLITTMNNAAVMLQHLKLFRESRLWFEESIAVCEEVSGKASVSTATLSFQLAQALALEGDPKGAVSRMRNAYNVFLTQLGPDDRNTKESEKWLEQLTQTAVSLAKQAKDVQSRRIRRVLMTPRVTLGTRTLPQVGQSPNDLVNGHDTANRSLDSRSIDELMRFIEGGGDASRSTPPKKRSTRGNPKRRGGATVGVPT